MYVVLLESVFGNFVAIPRRKIKLIKLSKSWLWWISSDEQRQYYLFLICSAFSGQILYSTLLCERKQLSLISLNKLCCSVGPVTPLGPLVRLDRTQRRREMAMSSKIEFRFPPLYQTGFLFCRQLRPFRDSGEVTIDF